MGFFLRRNARLGGCGCTAPNAGPENRGGFIHEFQRLFSQLMLTTRRDFRRLCADLLVNCFLLRLHLLFWQSLGAWGFFQRGFLFLLSHALTIHKETGSHYVILRDDRFVDSLCLLLRIRFR